MLCTSHMDVIFRRFPRRATLSGTRHTIEAPSQTGMPHADSVALAPIGAAGRRRGPDGSLRSVTRPDNNTGAMPQTLNTSE